MKIKKKYEEFLYEKGEKEQFERSKSTIITQ